MDNELFEDLPLRLVVNPAADHIVVSVPLYERLRAAPMHPGPLLVWEHLWYTARMQGTKRVWATNKYLAKGTGLGEATVKRAKAWLVAEGLIRYLQGRVRSGAVARVYTELVGEDRRVEIDPPAPQGQNRPCGETPKNEPEIEVPPQGRLPHVRSATRAVNDPGIGIGLGEERKGEEPPPAPQRQELLTVTMAALYLKRRGRRLVFSSTQLERLSAIREAYEDSSLLAGFRAWLERTERNPRPPRFFLDDFETLYAPRERGPPKAEVERRCDRGHTYRGLWCDVCAREDAATPAEVGAQLRIARPAERERRP